MGNSGSQQLNNSINNVVRQQQTKRISPPKKPLILSNGQKIRQPDMTLIKKTLLFTSPNIQANKVQNNSSIKQEINSQSNKQLHNNLIVKLDKKQQIKQTAISTSTNNNNLIYLDNSMFIQTLWALYLKKEANKEQITIQKFMITIMQTIQKCKQQFNKKLKKGQIHAIFTTKQQQKSYKQDVKIFEIALKNKIYQYYQHNNNSKSNKQLNKPVQQQIKQQISQIGRTIIYELMGKSSIWRSLMKSKQQQQEKIIQMLIHQGISQQLIKTISINIIK